MKIIRMKIIRIKNIQMKKSARMNISMQMKKSKTNEKYMNSK